MLESQIDQDLIKPNDEMLHECQIFVLYAFYELISDPGEFKMASSLKQHFIDVNLQLMYDCIKHTARVKQTMTKTAMHGSDDDELLTDLCQTFVEFLVADLRNHGMQIDDCGFSELECYGIALDSFY